MPIEIKKVMSEEQVNYITLPSIIIYENGYYVFNRTGENKIILDRNELIEDMKKHFEIEINKLNELLKDRHNSSSNKDCTTCHYWTSYCDLTREKIIRKNCKDYIQRSPS